MVRDILRKGDLDRLANDLSTVWSSANTRVNIVYRCVGSDLAFDPTAGTYSSTDTDDDTYGTKVAMDYERKEAHAAGDWHFLVAATAITCVPKSSDKLFEVSGVGSWTVYISNGADVYKTTYLYEPAIVRMAGATLVQGAGKDTLNDHEWCWEANLLYIRDDSGTPTSTKAGEEYQMVAIEWGPGRRFYFLTVQAR